MIVHTGPLIAGRGYTCHFKPLGPGRPAIVISPHVNEGQLRQVFGGLGGMFLGKIGTGNGPYMIR